jgi:hypothetical protein
MRLVGVGAVMLALSAATAATTCALSKWGGRAPSPATRVEWPTLTAYSWTKGLVGLPPAIRDLDGERVQLEGYLFPLYEFENIREFFLLSSDPHAGVVATGVTGTVLVRLIGDKGVDLAARHVQVVGTFHARETFEQGYLAAPYLIDTARALPIP